MSRALDVALETWAMAGITRTGSQSSASTVIGTSTAELKRSYASCERPRGLMRPVSRSAHVGISADAVFAQPLREPATGFGQPPARGYSAAALRSVTGIRSPG